MAEPVDTDLLQEVIDRVRGTDQEWVLDLLTGVVQAYGLLLDELEPLGFNREKLLVQLRLAAVSRLNPRAHRALLRLLIAQASRQADEPVLKKALD